MTVLEGAFETGACPACAATALASSTVDATLQGCEVFDEQYCSSFRSCGVDLNCEGGGNCTAEWNDYLECAPGPTTAGNLCQVSTCSPAGTSAASIHRVGTSVVVAPLMISLMIVATCF